MAKNNTNTVDEILTLPDDEIDIATAFLILSNQWGNSVELVKYKKQIDEMAECLRPILLKCESPDNIVETINSYIFDTLRYEVPESANFAAILKGNAKDDERLFLLHYVLDTRKGNCVGMSILYVSLSERLNLPIYAAVTPYHWFVRYDDGEKRINIETTDEGNSYSDSYYAEKFMIPSETMYLTNLGKRQVIGCFMTYLGAAYTKQKKLEDAIAGHQTAINIVPGYANAHYLLGTTYAYQGDLEKATAEYEAAIRINPNYARAYYGLGIAYDKQDMPEEAEAAYGETISIKPDYAEAHNNLGNIYKDQGKIDEAVAEYRAAIEAKPDLPQPHHNLASVYDNQGRLDEAIAEWKTLISLNPDDASTHYGLGITYKKQNKLEEAIEEYKRAINIKSDYAEAHNNLGNIYKDQGRIDEAIAEYRTAIEAKPDLPQPHYNMAKVHKDKGELDDAIEEFREVVRLRPEHIDSRSKLAYVYWKKRLLNEAIEEYKEVAKLKPEDANIHHYWGHAYFDNGMFSEAIGEWKITIQLNPDDARLYGDIRNAYSKAGKLDQLIEETKGELETDEQNAWKHYLLALALSGRGDANPAIETFRNAIQLAPSREEIHNDYIELMVNCGRYAEVRREYKDLVKTQPENELWGKLLENMPKVRARCPYCIGRGILNLAWLQFLLLTGISSAVASFSQGLTSSTYLSLIIYVAFICLLYLPFNVAFNVVFNINILKGARDDFPKAGFSPITRHIIGIVSLLIAHFRFVPAAVLIYASIQIFQRMWWLPVAALFILFKEALHEVRNNSCYYLMKGKPLEDSELANRLTKLTKRSGVKVKEVLSVDCPYLNACVDGTWFHKRILLTNIMLQQFSASEVEAIFAHELGHLKTHSMQWQRLAGAILIFARLYLANLIYVSLLSVYGFFDPGEIAAFPLLAFSWLVLGLPVRIILSWISRYFESKVDQYAISEVGKEKYLLSLHKLLKEQKENILSPVIKFVCHSHPCREKRLHIS